MDKSKLAFGRINYILLVVGVAIVVIGFILMSGGTSTKEMFNPEVFSPTRIKVAPCLLYTSPSPRDVEESRMPSSA